jgi:hypothetical protein
VSYTLRLVLKMTFHFNLNFNYFLQNFIQNSYYSFTNSNIHFYRFKKYYFIFISTNIIIVHFNNFINFTKTFKKDQILDKNLSKNSDSDSDFNLKLFSFY